MDNTESEYKLNMFFPYPTYNWFLFKTSCYYITLLFSIFLYDIYLIATPLFFLIQTFIFIYEYSFVYQYYFNRQGFINWISFVSDSETSDESDKSNSDVLDSDKSNEHIDLELESKRSQVSVSEDESESDKLDSINDETHQKTD